MKSHFELSPAEYEAGRQGHLQRRRIALVAREVALAGAGRAVLEVGCGPGDVLAAVAHTRPDLQFVGIDVDAAMIAHARAAHGAPNVAFECVGLGAESLDVRAGFVFGIDVLHHIHDLDRFVDAVAAVLEPGGTWVVVEPNSRNPYIWLHQERMRRAGLDEDHFRRRPFERAARRAGLRVVDRSTAFAVPGAVQSVPPLVARAERVLERVPGLGGSVVYRLSPA